MAAQGQDYLCLDMDPSEKGYLGQIILTAVDCDDHFVIAPNFTKFLSVYFLEFQNGDIDLDED